jgi:hypothetical protein
MHISVTTNAARKTDEKAEELRSQLADAFEGKPSLRYTDLKVYLTEQLKLKSKAADYQIKKATELRVIEKNVNRYTLKT